jgi:hypothetical protein
LATSQHGAIVHVDAKRNGVRLRIALFNKSVLMLFEWNIASRNFLLAFVRQIQEMKVPP